jgi:hypothetical protein
MQEKAPPDKPKISTEEHPSILSDAKLRRLVSWFAVDGVIVLSVCCFGFMGYQAIWGKPSPENWLLALVKEHYAAVLWDTVRRVLRLFHCYSADLQPVCPVPWCGSRTQILAINPISCVRCRKVCDCLDRRLIA